jgi:hypothetical protein
MRLKPYFQATAKSGGPPCVRIYTFYLGKHSAEAGDALPNIKGRQPGFLSRMPILRTGDYNQRHCRHLDTQKSQLRNRFKKVGEFTETADGPQNQLETHLADTLLAKMKQVINSAMLEAALGLRFKGKALEAAQELTERIEIV